MTKDNDSPDDPQQAARIAAARAQFEFDQSMATIREQAPALWWALYAGCISRGFTEEQALELVKASIISTTK